GRRRRLDRSRRYRQENPVRPTKTPKEMKRPLGVALAVGWAVLCASCAPALMKLPAGGGTLISAGDAEQALSQAVASCSSRRTLTAEVNVTGSVGGRRLRVRVVTGVAPPQFARLEALAPFGGPLFVFVAADDMATLLLPRDGRVLEGGRADAVLEA